MVLKKTWNLLDDTQGHQEEEEKADGATTFNIAMNLIHRNAKGNWIL
jgi:hypothetical protein